MTEVDIIKKNFVPLSKDFTGSLLLEDDAALLDLTPGHQLVVTTDILTSGIHFHENDPADVVARKSLRVNLSDIAAMGAKPLTYQMGLSLPKPLNQTWLGLFVGGLDKEQQRYGIALSGGDMASTPGPLSIAITMLGELQSNNALKRSNAKIGDVIWVSGTIGDAGLALKVVNGEIKTDNKGDRRFLLERLHLPKPRLELGQNLVGVANSAADISDGLIVDLDNICRASGLGAVIRAMSVPKSDCVSRLISKSKKLDISTILVSGDDYELVFTASPDHTNKINALSDEIGVKITNIGNIVESQSVRVIDESGNDLVIGEKGYSHF